MPIFPGDIATASGGGVTYLGDIRQFVRPRKYLLPGWFALTGEGFGLSSPEGKQLLKLSTELWWIEMTESLLSEDEQNLKIKIDQDFVYLPTWTTLDGRAPYLRPAVSGDVGQLQTDAIREMTGEVSCSRGAVQMYGPTFKGVFVGSTYQGSASWSGNVTGNYNLRFKASNEVPTAIENRVLSRTCTIAMNLMTN